MTVVAKKITAKDPAKRFALKLIFYKAIRSIFFKKG